MFALALLLATPADPQAIMDSLRAAREQYHECVVTQAVRLGEGNTETAETVLTAVASACRAHEGEVIAAYRRTPISQARVAALFARDEKAAQEDATAALLQARVK